MKKLLLISAALLMSVSMLDASTASKKSGDYDRLCKLFTKKADMYKLHMRSDDYAKATLASYEKRAKVFCAKSK